MLFPQFPTRLRAAWRPNINQPRLPPVIGPAAKGPPPPWPTRERGPAAVLPRVLEPEVMDWAEEARDYDAMDHAAVNRAFVADFLAVWDGAGPVLDVGAGTAQIPLELCRQRPAVR